METALNLLIVDDDEVDRMAVRRALKSADVQAILTEACDAAEALATLQRAPFDCVFLDYRLPDQDGLALVQAIRAAGIQAPLIVLTGQGDEQIAVDLMKAGANDYLSKSKISPGRLAQMLRNALRLYQAEQQVAQASQQLQESYTLLVQKNEALEQQQQQIQAQNLQLQQSIAEREQMMLQREDFIAHLTHDLRTPLFASDTMLKMFQKEAFCPLPPDMHRAITAMIRSNQTLMQIVDTLLEVHSYEAGVKTLTLMPCNIGKLAREVLQELVPLAQEKGIDLRLQGGSEPNHAEPIVQGDYLELHRMLINLVGNSIKFTETGSIKLRVTPGCTSVLDASKAWVLIDVQDTGYGMSEAEQATLFERFRKGTHKQAGSGLGLHLVYRIVQAHHGRIEVCSAVGQGSLFTISLPGAN
jgi:signal transduction histidine kinase